MGHRNFIAINSVLRDEFSSDNVYLIAADSSFILFEVQFARPSNTNGLAIAP